jgi:hypothetical protein
LRLTLRGSTKSDNWTELFARTEVVECAGEPVRILGDEDHLRLLCMHLLRSGARRPPWLCDVALLVEQDPSRSPTVRKGSAVSADFDWDICLGSDPVHANWVAIAIKLAHELLGANIQAEDPRQRTECAVSKLQSQELPRWLVPAVLKQWGGCGNAPSGSPTVRKGSASNLSAMSAAKDQRALPNGRASAWIRPWTLDLGPWTNLYRRWDNPIRATAAVGGRFNNWPRLPYRLAESFMRLPELLAGFGNFPASFGDFPADLGKFPADSGKFPADLGKFPADLGKFPADLGKFPADLGKVPSRLGKVPKQT